MKDVYELNSDRKFDIILTTENIEHVSDPIKYLEAIVKILKQVAICLLLLHTMIKQQLA